MIHRIALVLCLIGFRAAAEPIVPASVEGVYDLQTPVPPLLRRELPPLKIKNPLTIMNTLSSWGVVISIGDPDSGYPKYLFQAIEIDSSGHRIKALSFGYRNAELQLEIDPSTHALSGWLRDPRLGPDFKLFGKQKFSTAPYFGPPTPPLPEQYTEGKFVPPVRTEEIGALYLTKSLVSPTELWRGQYTFPTGEGAPNINFEGVSIDFTQRTVQLVEIIPETQHFLKWVYAIVANQGTGEVSLVGMRFNTSYGQVNGSTLVKE